MSLVHIRNADTGAWAEVSESAVPILRASNWDLVPADEVEAAERVAAEQTAAVELAMTQAANPSAPAPTTGEAE